MLRLAVKADQNALPAERSVTVAQAALLLGVDESTIRRLIDSGDLIGHRVGVKLRGVRVYLSSVTDYRERNIIGKSAPKREEAPGRKPRRKVEPSAELEEALAYMRSLGLRV